MANWLRDAPMSAQNKRADTPLHAYLVRLMRGENLSFNEAADFFSALTANDANTAQIGGCLVALASKGETHEELGGMASRMNKLSLKLRVPKKRTVDVAGTGSSQVKTFNVSTAAAFVAAGAGINIAKHTSRGVTSRVGSADTLSKLDVKIAGDPKLAEACLNGAGIGFLFAPAFHPILTRVADTRRALGIRTTLNLLGPLSNPSDAPHQLLGVWHKSLVKPMAQALALCGTKKSWVVHGSDGLDEITVNGPTLVAEVTEKKIRTFELRPEDFGLKNENFADIAPQTADESAKVIREVLESKRRDAARSLVIANAAAAILIGGLAKEPMQAARLAEQSLDSGSARIKLDRLIQTTNR